MAEAPFYTVTCKLFGIFPVKDVKMMMVDRQEVTAGGEAIGIYVKTDGIPGARHCKDCGCVGQ